jgi:hypothetical protein
MDVDPQTFRIWEAQHVAAERSRMLAKMATEKRLKAAKARVEAALRVLEQAARLEGQPVR